MIVLKLAYKFFGVVPLKGEGKSLFQNMDECLVTH